MRKGTIDINGIKYPVIFSIGTQIALEDQKIDIKKSAESISATMHLLYEMMVSGHKWAVKNSEEAPDLPSFDDLIESMDTDDIVGIMSKLVPIISGERKVLAKPAKK